MLDALLKRIYRLTRDRNLFILILACLVATASLVYILIGFNFRSSFLDLLPQEDPVVKEYRQRKDLLANVEHLILPLTIQKEGISPSKRKEILYSAATRLKNDLIRSEEIESVQFKESATLPSGYKLLEAYGEDSQGDIKEVLSSLEAFELGGVGEDQREMDLAQIYKKLEEETEKLTSEGEKDQNSDGESLLERKKRIYELNEKVLAVLEELTAIEREEKTVNEFSSPLRDGKEENGYLSPDKKMLLVQAKPRLPSSEGVKYCRKVKKIAENLIKNHRKYLKEKGLSVRLAGNYITVTQNSDSLRGDMALTTVISSLGILVIFFLAIGSWLYSMMIVFPLFVSLVFTMGWAKFSVGGFNLLTSFLPALVLGLGIDYGIHLLTRFSKKRREGVSLHGAVKDTILTKGKGSFLAALTTSLVFASLIFSKAKGFQEMGIITSVGIMSSFLVYLLVVPSMIFLVSKWGKLPPEVDVFDYRSKLRNLINWVLDRKKPLLTGILILTAVMGYQASNIEFQFAGNNVSPNVESLQTLGEIQERYGSENLFGPSFLFFPDSESKLDQISEKLREMDIVTDLESARDHLPGTLEEMKELPGIERRLEGIIRNLRLIRANIDNKKEIMNSLGSTIGNLSILQFSSTLSNRSLTVSQIDSLMEQLISIRKKLQTIEAAGTVKQVKNIERDLEIISKELRKISPIIEDARNVKDLLRNLPPTVRSRFLTDRGEYVLYARVKSSIYNSSDLNKFVDSVSELTKDFFGIPLINYRLEESLERDFLLSTLLAFVTIFVLLFLGMDGTRASLLSAVPLILGYIWMIGGMKIFGMNFNFINITISPLLIGVGIDNGIHLIHLFQSERSSNLRESIVSVFSNTGLAIITTSMTTITVFGCLLISRTPGLRLLGLTALMGLGFTMVFSMTALPTAISLAFRERD